MGTGFPGLGAFGRNRVTNRRRPALRSLHGLLTQIHPSLERVLGPRLQHPAVVALLERFGSPDHPSGYPPMRNLSVACLLPDVQPLGSASG